MASCLRSLIEGLTKDDAGNEDDGAECLVSNWFLISWGEIGGEKTIMRVKPARRAIGDFYEQLWGDDLVRKNQQVGELLLTG